MMKDEGIWCRRIQYPAHHEHLEVHFRPSVKVEDNFISMPDKTLSFLRYNMQVCGTPFLPQLKERENFEHF